MRLTFLSAVAAAALTACGAQTDAPTSQTPTEATGQAPVASTSTDASQAEPTGDIAMQLALAGEHRSDEEKARDVWRNPSETLAFFNVTPDSKVVEVFPGGGWYTNIIAPYLASGTGTLVAAGFDANAFEGERQERVIERVAAFKETYSDAKFGTLEHSAFSSVSGPLTEAGTADVVLSFRNLHSWMGGGYAEKFFTDAFDALKPGGTLGVVQHRLPSTATQDPTAATGYVHEDYVKSLALAAGFEFVASSDINANPADTADHPFGVWTLSPNNRTSDRDGNTPEGFDPAAYSDLGESDRMTLKFVKPG